MLNIVLTGGPSTGKTTVLNSINEYFKELGYKVIVVPETATILINSGIKPCGDDSIPGVDFQSIVLESQLKKEELAKKAANILDKDKTIILYDRGALDGYAYVEDDEWERVLKNCNVNKRDLLSRYDAILYLEGSVKFFTKENNTARYESDANVGLEKGKRVLKAYLGHDSLRVIKPRDDIQDKCLEVINIILNMVGKPIRTRNQRKYLIESVDLDKMNVDAVKTIIHQDYLKIVDNVEYRVRSIEQEGNISYHFSIIRRLSNGKRELVKEERITKEAYENLLLTKDIDTLPIDKTRYSFVYREQYYKLDIFAEGLTMLEVNLTKENPNVNIPDFINISKDVTNDDEYKNASLATRKADNNGKRKDNSNRGHRLLR